MEKEDAIAFTTRTGSLQFSKSIKHENKKL